MTHTAAPPAPTPKVAWDTAAPLAEHVQRCLERLCRPARIEIAGSIRRRAPFVKDIEIVMEPNPREGQVLFGGPPVIPGYDIALMLEGALVRDGHRYKQIANVFDSALAVDIFIVRPPAQWGALFAIRTGPKAHNIAVLRALGARGLHCDRGRVIKRDANGALSRELATPTEAAFYKLAGMKWIKPEDRT